MTIKTIIEDGYYISIAPDGTEIGRGSKKDKRYAEISEYADSTGISGEYRVLQPDVKVGLIACSDLPVTPPNNAPEWLTPIVASAQDGVGATISLLTHAFDQEGDALTFTLNASSTALPAWASISGSDLVITSGCVEGSYPNIIIDVKDATSSLIASSPFIITITEAAGGAPDDPDWIIPASFDYGSGGYWDGDNPSATVLTHRNGHSRTSVQPGDIIQLAAGTRGHMRMRNIHGASGNRVIIRSDPAGKTTFRRPTSKSNGFVWQVQHFDHVTIDGSYTTGVSHGIKITSTASGDSPSSYLHLFGVRSDYTLRYIEVDGDWPNVSAGGIGIQDNDQSLTRNDFLFVENILVEHCIGSRTHGEGIYLGPNYESTYANKPDLRNIEVRYSVMNYNGRDGCNIKCTIEGNNSFHDNICIGNGARTSGEPNAGQKAGFSFFEGCGDAYNNYIVDSGEAGIGVYCSYRPNTFVLPPFRVWNNVIIDSGVSTMTIAQDGIGITCGTALNGAMPEYVEIYNNTIIRSENDGIDINGNISTPVTIQNNIVCGSGGPNIQNNGTGTATVNNNETGSVASQNFVSGIDFHLTSSSPARNEATTGLVSTTDIDGNARPMGAYACRGAYEFIE